MSVFDKFFERYSYKFPKGYPDFTNKQDILILENILDEIGLFEVATPDTEDLHEILTAMFVAGHQPDWDSIVDGSYELPSKLRNKDQHRNLINKYINKDTPDSKLKRGTGSYFKLYKDAEQIADKLKNNLGYNGPIESERVFADGKKVKADIIIYQPNRDKEGLGISLKYGKGQFNNLSPNTVLKSLYRLDDLQVPTDEKKKVDGILSQVTKDNKDAEESINMGAKTYVNFVLDNYQDIKGDGKKTQAYLNDKDGRDFKSIIDKVKDSGEISIRKSKQKELGATEVSAKDITWKQWKGATDDIQKAFSKAYNAQPLSTLSSTEYLPKKAKAINTVMKDYIESQSGIKLNDVIDGKSDEGKKIKQFLAVILGSTDKSYYYIGDGGGKVTFIPSLERLDKLEYYIKPKYNESSGNFIIDLIVYGKAPEGEWTELFSTDVNLRFSGDGGQFTSDISQKASTFSIGKTGDEININKLFGFN